MKYLKWILALALAIGAGVFLYVSSLCSLDGMSACYDQELTQFKVEENAHLRVQVENEVLAEYLRETWAELHPESTLEVIVQKELSLDELKDMPSDIMIADQRDAAFFINEFQDLGSLAYSKIGSTIPVELQDAMNLKGFFMVQNTVSGPLFVRNETLINELGLTLNTFDDLFTQKEKIKESISTVLPISFLDQEAFYPFLTAGGWALNSSHVGEKGGFDSEEFLNGLKFVASLKDHLGIDAVDLEWNYESSFFERNALVSIINDRSLASQYEALSGDEYVYGPSLSINEKVLAPFANVSGYVVKADTGFTSSASEVLRILRSPEAISLLDSVPIYHINHIDDLDLDEDTKMLVSAYNYSVAYPIVALESNPSVLARNFYRDVDLMPVLISVYDGDITGEEGQKFIVSLYHKWLTLNGVEGLNDDME